MRRRLHASDPGADVGQGELMSEISTWDVRLVPVADVKIDKKFQDSRIYEDPLHPDWYANEGQSISDLCESMGDEGLKLPIVVIPDVDRGKEVLMLRAGRRRLKAARRLGWRQIPAIILPGEMPLEWQHWYNILENSGRKNLTTYELAVSIKNMRDQFFVKAADFARKTGYSPGYVSNLLGCIDRLPPYLIEQWRDGARIALDQWISLSHLDHEDAIRAYHRIVGISQKDRLRMLAKGRKKSLPAPRWLARMQRLYVGIEGSELPPRTRDVILKAIEVCMGQRDDVPGVYEPGKQRRYEKKARLRRELALPELPEPGEDKEMPPPREEVA
jgi:ParB/RepB/Spo0J family partition protein